MAENEEVKKEGEESEATDEAKGKAGKQKLLLIVGGIIVLLIAIGTPLTFMMLNSKPEKDTEHIDADSAQNEESLIIEGFEEEFDLEEDEEPLGAILPLETFVVNLTEGGYLRCQIQLEFETRDIPKRFYVRQVPIRDSLLSFFASYSKKDLFSENGKRDMKKDIKDLINEILRRQEVRRVYFTQFVVQ